MPEALSRLRNLGEVMTQHGTHMALALAVLIAGLLFARLVDKTLRGKMPITRGSTTFCKVVYISIVLIVVMASAVVFGAKPVNVFRLFSIIALSVVGLAIFLKPFLPSMPFKVGNTVKAADLLGKVEAISFLNTRLRTFDGKTFFVPNRKILNDIVINYHFTQTRRIKIDVAICYHQDLLKAKRVLESVMIEDVRVKIKPAPIVYVTNLSGGCVELGGRCWVDNADYWIARCDLLEKTKLRFDREDIHLAYPQLQVHYDPDKAKIDTADRTQGEDEPRRVPSGRES